MYYFGSEPFYKRITCKYDVRDVTIWYVLFRAYQWRTEIYLSDVKFDQGLKRKYAGEGIQIFLRKSPTITYRAYRNAQRFSSEKADFAQIFGRVGRNPPVGAPSNPKVERDPFIGSRLSRHNWHTEQLFLPPFLILTTMYPRISE